MEKLICPECKYDGRDGWLLSNPVQCPDCFHERSKHINPVSTTSRTNP